MPDNVTMALPPQISRVRLHRADYTAFGEEKVDPLQPLGTAWLNIYRVGLYGGLFLCLAGQQMLALYVDERAQRKIDEEKEPPHSGRAFSEAGPQPADGRRLEEQLPCADVIEQLGRDEDGLRIIGDKVVRYDSYMMLRPLRRLKHTILDEAAVWQAECQVMTWFFATAILTLESVHMGRPVLLYLWQDLLTGDGGVQRMGDFVKAITAFTAFFLGLFTSLTLGRVQTIWDGGVMRIFKSTEKLCVMLTTDLPERWMETDDPTQPPREVEREAVVSAFHRWSQASIIMLFEKYGRNSSNDDMLRMVHQKGLVTDAELQDLQAIPDNHALAIWSWHFKLIHKCLTNGLGPAGHMQPYHIVHNEGIFGVTTTMEMLKQPLPFSYISLISMFVKFMNIAVTASGGIMCTRALLYHNEVEALFSALFAFTLPLVTNSIVVLNLYLSNPMRDHFTSMCPDDIVIRLDKGAKAAQAGSLNFPAFLVNKWEKKE